MSDTSPKPRTVRDLWPESGASSAEEYLARAYATIGEVTGTAPLAPGHPPGMHCTARAAIRRTAHPPDWERETCDVVLVLERPVDTLVLTPEHATALGKALIAAAVHAEAAGS